LAAIGAWLNPMALPGLANKDRVRAVFMSMFALDERTFPAATKYNLGAGVLMLPTAPSVFDGHSEGEGTFSLGHWQSPKSALYFSGGGIYPWSPAL